LPRKKQKDNYATVRFPQEFAKEVHSLIGTKGFTSRAEIVKEALRDLLIHYGISKPVSLPRFDRINGDSTGVSVYDREMKDDKVIHISVKPNGIQCDFHQRNDCEHVKYALSLPDVQEMIRKRRKEGWKIDLPEVT
jgi:hypothetical protein